MTPKLKLKLPGYPLKSNTLLLTLDTTRRFPLVKHPKNKLGEAYTKIGTSTTGRNRQSRHYAYNTKQHGPTSQQKILCTPKRHTIGIAKSIQCTPEKAHQTPGNHTAKPHNEISHGMDLLCGHPTPTMLL